MMNLLNNIKVAATYTLVNAYENMLSLSCFDLQEGTNVTFAPKFRDKGRFML